MKQPSTLAEILDQRLKASDALASWQLPDPVSNDLARITQTVDVTDWKGEVLPTDSAYRPVPADALTANAQAINLAAGAPIAVAGSFAPTVSDAAVTYIAETNAVTIFYDGTHNSRRFSQRRTDGFSETLPAGSLRVTELTPGAPGGTAPTYGFLAFFAPGSCNVGWIAGDAGTPAFAHTIFNAEAVAKQRQAGREPLTDGYLMITLQAVPVPPPAPPPPVSDPGSQVGNTGVNGSLTLVVDSPGQGAVVNISFNVNAHASDSSGHTVTGWQLFIEGNGTPIYDTPGPLSNISVPVNLNPGTYAIVTKVWNGAGTMAQVRTPITVQDLSPTPPPVDPVTPDPPDPTPIRCVMLGTPIEVIGDSPFSLQQFPQNEWVRVVTDSNRVLVAVPNHRIYTTRAGATEMRDVRRGDSIVCVGGEETVLENKQFVRPGVKVCVHMDKGHLYWANGVLSHNVKLFDPY
jgi:hypothetical protein